MTEPSIQAVSTSGRQGCGARGRPVGTRGLRLICRHQRSATGIAEEDNVFHRRDFAEPLNADTDVLQSVFEDEAAFEAAESGVPAKEADASAAAR